MEKKSVDLTFKKDLSEFVSKFRINYSELARQINVSRGNFFDKLNQGGKKFSPAQEKVIRKYLHNIAKTIQKKF